MFTKSTKYYDRIYREFKDYDAEAKAVHDLIRQRSPGAKTILDVGCGTGEHASFLTSVYDFEVDGLDIEESFLDIARQKCPQGEFIRADMLDFDLEKRYDVVTCLFSAIGYVKTIENTTKAIGNFARHLGPNGIMIVEPWISKAGFNSGYYQLRTVDTDDLKVARLSYSEIIDNFSRITFEYLIGADGQLIRETEVHELGLLTTEELSGCFTENGLNFEYDEVGLMDRGLFIASK